MEAGAKARQPFSAHIYELRRRLLWSMALLLVGGSVGYAFREPLIMFLQNPLGQPLYYNSPAGAFEFAIRISLLAGLVVAIPALLYNSVRFIEPALKTRLRTHQLAALTSISFLLAIGGLAFAYYVVIPLSLHFFADFSSAQIKPLISATDYLSFVTTCLTTFVLMFQIPLLLLFIDRITPLPPRRLRQYRRHVVVGSLIIAVALPFTYDPVTQFVIAVPIITLYELSIILISLAHRRRAKRSIRENPVPAQIMPTNTTPLPPRRPQPLSLPDNRYRVPATISSRPVPGTNVINLRHANVLDLRHSH